MFSPAVLTSKKADEHYAKIQTRHTEMLQGMQMQSLRVQAINQQQDMEKKESKLNADSMQNEMKQAEAAANTAALKTALDFQSKQEELAIKRSALSAV